MMNKAIKLMFALIFMSAIDASAQRKPEISYDFLITKTINNVPHSFSYDINYKDPTTVTLVRIGHGNMPNNAAGTVELDAYVTDKETGKQYTVTEIGNNLYGIMRWDEKYDFTIKIPHTVQKLDNYCFTFVPSVYTMGELGWGVTHFIKVECDPEGSLNYISAGAFDHAERETAQIVVLNGIVESTYCLPKNVVLGQVELINKFMPFPDGVGFDLTERQDIDAPPIFTDRQWYYPDDFSFSTPRDTITIRCLTAIPPKVTGTLFQNYVETDNPEEGFPCISHGEVEIYATKSLKHYDMCVLTVPKGCREAYASHEEWGKFKNIVESQEPAGIDILQPDSEGCTMTGVDGGIRVSATGSHMVTVHDIHGRSIRQVRVADGSQLIELPAGFYIVTTDGTAAQKLLVR